MAAVWSRTSGSIKHYKLSEQITTLTEGIEELKSEKTMILNSMNCADDVDFRKAKKNVDNLETQKVTLEQAEIKFTAELDSTLEKYNSVEYNASHVDADELDAARIELRTNKEQSALSQLQKFYRDRFDYDMMRQSKQEVRKMLGEDTRKPSIKQTLQRKRKETEVHAPGMKRKRQKGYER